MTTGRINQVAILCRRRTRRSGPATTSSDFGTGARTLSGVPRRTASHCDPALRRGFRTTRRRSRIAETPRIPTAGALQLAREQAGPANFPAFRGTAGRIPTEHPTLLSRATAGPNRSLAFRNCLFSSAWRPTATHAPRERGGHELVERQVDLAELVACGVAGSAGGRSRAHRRRLPLFPIASLITLRELP